MAHEGYPPKQNAPDRKVGGVLYVIGSDVVVEA